jgi:hypothetical protein
MEVIFQRTRYRVDHRHAGRHLRRRSQCQTDPDFRWQRTRKLGKSFIYLHPDKQPPVG